MAEPNGTFDNKLISGKIVGSNIAPVTCKENFTIHSHASGDKHIIIYKQIHGLLQYIYKAIMMLQANFDEGFPRQNDRPEVLADVRRLDAIFSRYGV